MRNTSGLNPACFWMGVGPLEETYPCLHRRLVGDERPELKVYFLTMSSVKPYLALSHSQKLVTASSPISIG